MKANASKDKLRQSQEDPLKFETLVYRLEENLFAEATTSTVQSSISVHNLNIYLIFDALKKM